MDTKKEISCTKTVKYERPVINKLSRENGYVAGPCGAAGGKGSDCSWK